MAGQNGSIGEQPIRVATPCGEAAGVESARHRGRRTGDASHAEESMSGRRAVAAARRLCAAARVLGAGSALGGPRPTTRTSTPASPARAASPSTPTATSGSPTTGTRRTRPAGSTASTSTTPTRRRRCSTCPNTYAGVGISSSRIQVAVDQATGEVFVAQSNGRARRHLRRNGQALRPRLDRRSTESTRLRSPATSTSRSTTRAASRGAGSTSP